MFNSHTEYICVICYALLPTEERHRKEHRAWHIRLNHTVLRKDSKIGDYESTVDVDDSNACDRSDA